MEKRVWGSIRDENKCKFKREFISNQTDNFYLSKRSAQHKTVEYFEVVKQRIGKSTLHISLFKKSIYKNEKTKNEKKKSFGLFAYLYFVFKSF